MKYRVAGGTSGDAGIEVAGRRYEVGDEVEMTQKQAEWLIEQGYLEPAGKTTFGKTAPAPVVEETVAPEVVADESEEDVA
jgi:hypothetical protein